MKRLVKYTVAGLLASALIALTGAFGWLLGTSDGARWLMGFVSRHTSVAISARRVEGRIWGSLSLEGARLKWSDGDAGVAGMQLKWHPMYLFAGKVAVTGLSLKDLHIRDNRPPSAAPPEIAWPRVTGLPAWLNLRIGKLRIDGLEYVRRGSKPFVADKIAATVMWQGKLLTVRKLLLSMPSVTAEGSLMAGFGRPSLLLRFSFTPTHPVARLDRISCGARLYPAGNPEQLAGTVSISGQSGGKKVLELSGDLGVTRKSLNLKKFRFSQPGRKGYATANGTVTLLPGGPGVDVKLAFSDLDLSRELHATTNLTGSLELLGTASAYNGNFIFSNRGTGWRSGRLAGSFKGNGESVSLNVSDGSLLDGSIRGNAGVNWLDGVSLRADLNLRKLNPSKIAPQWKGVVNADLRCVAQWPRSGASRYEFAGKLLQSRLHGRELAGTVNLDISEGNLLIRELALHGRGFDIKAGGELRKRLTFTARIGNMGGLIPDAAGKLDADGWLRWDNGRLEGDVAGSGRNLKVDGAYAAAMNFSTMMPQGPNYPLHIKVEARNAGFRKTRVNSFALAVDGDLGRHTIDAGLHSDRIAFRATLSGGYEKKRWKGILTSLSGHDSVGPWKLRSPATLAVSADSLTLGRLVLDGAAGEYLDAQGWLRFHPVSGEFGLQWSNLNLTRVSPLFDGAQISGSSSGTLQAGLPGGDRLLLKGRADAAGSAVVREHGFSVRQASVSADWNERGISTSLDIRLADGGNLRGDFTSRQPARIGLPESGSFVAEWNGIDMVTARPLLPKDLAIKGKLGGRLEGNLASGTTLTMKGDTSLVGGSGQWQKNEDRVSADFHTAEVSWAWRGGKKAAGTGPGSFRTESLLIKGAIDATGSALLEGRRINFRKASIAVDGGKEGMRGTLALNIEGGGVLYGSFTSASSAASGLPEQGKVEADWKGVDLSLLRPWLKKGLDLEGTLSGRMDGSLLPGGNLDLQGSSSLSGGEVRWNSAGRQLGAKFKSADLAWAWRNKSLSGDLAIALEQYGQVRGKFALPVPAHLPVSADASGQVAISLNGHVAELGMLTALFPGLIQESSGVLDVAAMAGGVWKNPEISGNLKLSNASAYLPTTGTRLKNAGFAAHFSGDQLIVDSFSVDSGPGHLEGAGAAGLKSWRIAEYHGNLKGDKFQVVYLPELQVQASPDLIFSGTPEKLVVRGDIHIPELLVRGSETNAPVQPSKDVVILGEEKKRKKESPLKMDVQVAVILGDNINVKYEGIDAKLKGSLNLTMTKPDNIRSSGEISVVKGSYKTYGIKLDITRGRIYYAGGPISQPRLDFQAMRKVGDVRAGVRVAGTPDTMSVKLYSVPNMPESSILSYIVLGQPLAYTSEQSGLITRAASGLVSTTSAYVPIQSAPPGVAPSKAAGSTLSQQVVSIGRYLTPSLYVSYGRSLLTGANLVHLRYDLTRHWQVETQTGTESGGDVFYKINFK